MRVIESIVNQGHGSCNPTYLFVHSTANLGAPAINHKNLYSRGYQYAVQYICDWTGDVYHCVPDDRLAWGVGNGNRYGVNLEICEGKTQDQFNKSWNTAVEFCAYYLKKRGWGIDRMMSHDECRIKWGGTDHTDPLPYFKKWGKTWADFKNAVSSKMKSAGWVKDSKGWWYRNADGSYPKAKWLKLDAWYYFNAEGYAVTGWQKIGGLWYYFGSDCRMKTGWQTIGGKKYYLHPSKDGNWKEGSAHIGWLHVSSKWYYFNKKDQGTECAMRTGWLDDKGKKYYLQPDKDGAMAEAETIYIDGKRYTFDKNGALV